jgi:hypothetical protein
MTVRQNMTKTEAKKHLADAKRSIRWAQTSMDPTPQWILNQTGGTNPTEAEMKTTVTRFVLQAEESLAALRRWLA